MGEVLGRRRRNLKKGRKLVLGRESVKSQKGGTISGEIPGRKGKGKKRPVRTRGRGRKKREKIA